MLLRLGGGATKRFWTTFINGLIAVACFSEALFQCQWPRARAAAHAVCEFPSTLPFAEQSHPIALHPPTSLQRFLQAGSWDKDLKRRHIRCLWRHEVSSVISPLLHFYPVKWHHTTVEGNRWLADDNSGKLSAVFKKNSTSFPTKTLWWRLQNIYMV